MELLTNQKTVQVNNLEKVPFAPHFIKQFDRINCILLEELCNFQSQVPMPKIDLIIMKMIFSK